MNLSIEFSKAIRGSWQFMGGFKVG